MAHLKLENNKIASISQEIFDNTQKDLGFVPNMYKSMGQNPALLDAYTYSYNSFRANSGFNPVEQEVVFLSVALSKLTRSLTANRGNVSQAEVDAFLAKGYNESHVLGIIAGIAVKTMSNYSNHNTHPEVDEAFAGRVWKK